MRAITIASIVLCVFLNTVCAATQANREARGKNDTSLANELKSIVGSFPELRGRIQGMRPFRTQGKAQNAIALIAFGEESGWQMYIFSRSDADKFNLDWKSGKLDDSFYVTGSEEFKVIRLDDGDVVTLEGCAAHLCPDEVFSIMLYVPSKRAAFTAKYVLGKITYSMNLRNPQDRRYKTILLQLVAERLKEWKLNSK